MAPAKAMSAATINSIVSISCPYCEISLIPGLSRDRLVTTPIILRLTRPRRIRLTGNVTARHAPGQQQAMTGSVL